MAFIFNVNKWLLSKYWNISHFLKKILISGFWGKRKKVWHQDPGSSITGSGWIWVATAPSKQAQRATWSRALPLFVVSDLGSAPFLKLAWPLRHLHWGALLYNLCPVGSLSLLVETGWGLWPSL